MKIFIGIPLVVLNDAMNHLAELSLHQWNEVARAMPDFDFEIVQAPVLIDERVWKPATLGICPVKTLTNRQDYVSVSNFKEVWHTPATVSGWNDIINYANQVTVHEDLNWILLAAVDVFMDANAVDKLIQMLLDEPHLYIGTGHRQTALNKPLPPNWIYGKSPGWKALDFNCLLMAAHDTRWQYIGDFDPSFSHEFWTYQDYVIRMLLAKESFGICGQAPFMSLENALVKLDPQFYPNRLNSLDLGRKHFIKKWFYDQQNINLNNILTSPISILQHCSQTPFAVR